MHSFLNDHIFFKLLQLPHELKGDEKLPFRQVESTTEISHLSLHRCVW